MWVPDGGTSTAEKAVQATKELVPLANQYPIAFAMLLSVAVAVGFFVYHVRTSGRHIERLSEMVVKLITVSDAHAEIQKAEAEQIKSLHLLGNTILRLLAVMADRMNLDKHITKDLPRD